MDSFSILDSGYCRKHRLFILISDHGKIAVYKYTKKNGYRILQVTEVEDENDSYREMRIEIDSENDTLYTFGE